eukprot:scaffold1.g5852.t1
MATSTSAPCCAARAPGARRERRSRRLAVRAVADAAPSAVQGGSSRAWNLLLPFGNPAAAIEQLEMEKAACSLNQAYSPALIREASLNFRGIRMSWELGTYFLALWQDALSGEDDRERVKVRATQLRDMLTRLGPTFIKAGQDDVPPFPDEQAFAIIEGNLGRPLGEVFSSISERPVAAASLGQVYKAVLRETGQDVAVKVQRPGVEPTIIRDLFIFRLLAAFINPLSQRQLGCNAELVVDEFGCKLLEELDYIQEGRNVEDFRRNFEGDPLVKIPWVRRDLSGPQVLVMEWIDGVRCTDVEGLKTSGIDLEAFIRTGVVSGLRQLLEFGLFHGDPHPGNIFAMADGRIAYVDFGNVAELSQRNKEVLIDAVVHAVNKDYEGMAGDFIKLGFLTPGTDVEPLVPALEKIWADSMGRSMSDFNFRTVTSKFNELVYQYPIRIPERYALVIRRGEVAPPDAPAQSELRSARRSAAGGGVLFQDGRFQWHRLENLLTLAKEGAGTAPGADGGLDLSATVTDGARVVLLDDQLRRSLLLAFTEDDRLHFEEVARLLRLVQDDLDPRKLLETSVAQLPQLARQLAVGWSDKVLSS